MMKNKQFFIYILVLLIGIGFVVQEQYKQKNTDFIIISYEDNTILQTEKGNVFLLEKTNSPQTKLLTSTIQPFIFRKKTINLNQELPQKNYQETNTTITKYTNNITRVLHKNKTIWYFNNPEKQELQTIIKSPISLKSDFWITTSANIPTQIPLPNKGIILTSKQFPSKKLTSITKEKNLPLISTKNSKIISLNWNNKWVLKSF